MFDDGNNTVSPDEIKPIWTGNKWKYNSKYYSSLRILKTRTWYKLETKLAKSLSQEIRTEIDEDILKNIRQMAN